MESSNLYKCVFLRYYREVMPGEIVKISRYDVQTLDIVPRPEGDPSAFCIFEYVYFARPDSIFEGKPSNLFCYRKCNLTVGKTYKRWTTFNLGGFFGMV